MCLIKFDQVQTFFIILKKQLEFRQNKWMHNKILLSNNKNLSWAFGIFRSFSNKFMIWNVYKNASSNLIFYMRKLLLINVLMSETFPIKILICCQLKKQWLISCDTVNTVKPRFWNYSHLWYIPTGIRGLYIPKSRWFIL